MITNNVSKTIAVACAAMMIFSLHAGAEGRGTDDSQKIHPNYELAARFSAEKVSQMVRSTSLTANWFKDSDKFWYEWETTDGKQYYIVDAVSGQKEPLFNMDKLAMELTTIVKDPFDAQHIPIEKLELKDDKVFTFEIKSTVEEKDSLRLKKFGKKKVFSFEYDIASKRLTNITGKEEEDKYPRWANVSPDGSICIYAKNTDMYWMDAENMTKAVKDEKDSTIVEHRITFDGTKDYAWDGNGYTGWTETDTTKRVRVFAILWSPDSKHFATMRTDLSGVKDLWVINSMSNPRPTLETYKYQMPGEPGPKSKLFVFDTEDMSHYEVKCQAWKDQLVSILSPAIRLNAEKYDETHSRKWMGDNSCFYITRQSRDMKRLDLCRIDLGADSTKTIVSERMNTYVEFKTPVMVNDGKQFVLWSERNGWANLYLYNLDGSLVRPLVEGAFHVEKVEGVNDPGKFLVFSVCGYNAGENPYQMHIFSVGYDGSGMKQIDVNDMNVDASVSDDGKYVVYNYSRVDAAPASALYATTGRKIMDLEAVDLSQLYEAGYKMPERFKVKAADGITDLYGVMYKPFDFDSTKVYPIIEYVYPGPQVEANNISWSKSMNRMDRLAQIGFIVITVGNRGGHPNRSKWYHNYGYGNLRDYGLADQKTAVQKLAAKYPWIDIDKVGIHGHSGGGFMSTAAILTYPDFYTAAVSCAGNHDNSVYNRWWSETHHGILEEITARGDTTFTYKIDKNQELAPNLKGHLLLVHGDMDNNVHPSNTIRVVDALIRANKRFDMLILPTQRHGFGDMNEYFFWRMADWFSEWLLGESQTDRVDIVQLNND